jgi:hypothetical protein
VIRRSAVFFAVEVPTVAAIAMVAVPSGAVGLIGSRSAKGSVPEGAIGWLAKRQMRAPTAAGGTMQTLIRPDRPGGPTSTKRTVIVRPRVPEERARGLILRWGAGETAGVGKEVATVVPPVLVSAVRQLIVVPTAAGDTT